jgi:acetyl-CoA synthetase
MQIQNFEQYQSAYQKSIENPESFWHGIAQNFTWQQPYDRVLNWNFDEPDVKWFINGPLNITENCLDRHLPHKATQIAYIFEANESNQAAQHISYQTLYEEVCRLANLLKSLDIGVGDRVCIYMPMIPQAIYAMLACARIGAIHSVVFAGFSAQALQERINDSQCKIILPCKIAPRLKKL